MKNFEDHEFFNVNKMSHNFLSRLDAFRSYIKSRVIVTSSNDPSQGHKEDSEHYKGLAVDIICPDWKGSLFSLYLIAERFGFSGIGLYPKWQLNGSVVGGLHLDERSVSYQGARWIGVPEFCHTTQKVKTKYHALNMKNLINLKIINSKIEKS